MMKYSSAMSGRAERENLWLSVMAHGPRCAWSVRHEIEPTFFPSGPTKLSRLVNILKKITTAVSITFFLLAAADSIIGRCARKRGCKAKTKH